MQGKGLLRPKICARPRATFAFYKMACTSQWPNMEIEKEKRLSLNPRKLRLF